MSSINRKMEEALRRLITARISSAGEILGTHTESVIVTDDGAWVSTGGTGGFAIAIRAGQSEGVVSHPSIICTAVNAREDVRGDGNYWVLATVALRFQSISSTAEPSPLGALNEISDALARIIEDGGLEFALSNVLPDFGVQGISRRESSRDVDGNLLIHAYAIEALCCEFHIDD